MAEATIVSESPKTRLDLAIILKVHDYYINQATDEVSKKSIESLDGEWWSASIPWILVKPKSTQSSLSVSGCDVESGAILVPNVERRKSIDDIQVRSKKIRLDQTGILNSIRQLAQLGNISVIRYVALLLYIVAVEQIGFKGIANIAWKIYNEESIPTLSNMVSPEKSTFLAYQLKLGKGKWRDLKYYLQSEGLVLATWEKLVKLENQLFQHSTGIQMFPIL
ncbi:hypothetical protein LOD99_1804 [Oopsacas minuta]|uniref:Uncharacterized protein n=1 Tax=Oopsacas minuta TaxID=111878 RepID=A0AAV7K351_9METZ|nr:hypothetical protein LOD99_1804 [Oopsacas minuta]